MAMTADQVERAMFSPKNTPAEQLKRTPAEGGATDEAVEEAAARTERFHNCWQTVSLYYSTNILAVSRV